MFCDPSVVENTHLSVSLSGSEFTNCHFPLSTGPLFSYGIDNAELNLNTSLKINTVHASTVFQNASSSLREISFAQSPLSISQIVSNCDFSKGVNHFYGTTVLDINAHTDCLIINSSFSDSITDPLSNAAYSNKSYTSSSSSISLSGSSDTTCTVTTCTFTGMSKNAGEAHQGGSAIYIHLGSTSLYVETSFFQNCKATGTTADGGAICFWGNFKKFTLFKSSLRNISTTDTGGGIMAYNTSSVVVDRCYFDTCKSGRSGGGVMNERANSGSDYSNTTFSGCSAQFGGGVHFIYHSTVSLEYLSFRGNTASNPSAACDIAIESTLPSITGCDTDSSSRAIHFSNNGTNKNNALWSIDQTLVTPELSTSTSGSTTTVSCDVGVSVSGTMNMLILSSSMYRLVHFTFSSSSTASTKYSTSVIPSGSYTMKGWSMVDYKATSQAVTGASSSLSGANAALISITGSDLPSSTPVAYVYCGGSIRLSLSRSSSTKYTSTMTLYPSSSAVASYGTKCTLTNVTSSGTKLFQKSGISFTLPSEPTRMVSVTSYNTDTDTVKISMSGRVFSASTYNITFTATSGSHSRMVQLSPYSSTTMSNWTATLFSLSTNDLNYATTYKISKFTTSTSSTSLQVDSGTFTTRAEPPRLVSVTRVARSDDITLTVKGRVLTESAYNVTFTRQGSTTPHVVVRTMSRTSNTTLSSWTATLYPLEDAELFYGSTYNVTSFTKSTSTTAILFVKTSFTTPVEPERLTNCAEAVTLDAEQKIATLELSSRQMVFGRKYTLVVFNTTNIRLVGAASFDVPTSGKMTATIFSLDGNADLDYSTKYEIVKVENSTGSTVLQHSGLFFTTPEEPPRMTGINSAPLVGLNSTVLSLTGRVLGEGKTYTLHLSGESVENPPLPGHTTTLEVTTDSELTAARGFTFYPLVDADLKYGMKYTVQQMVAEEETESILVEKTRNTFITPIEPARIETISTRISFQGHLAIIHFGGVRMKEQVLTLVVADSDGTQVTVKSLLEEIEEGVWKGEFAADFTQTPTCLESGKEYTIITANDPTQSILINAGLVIDLPKPPRVDFIDSTLAASSFVHFTVNFYGDYFPHEEEEFLLKLAEFEDYFLVTFQTTETGRSVDIKAGLPGEMQFNTSYTLTSLVSVRNTSEYIICSGMTFISPPGPTLLNSNAINLKWNPTNIIITLVTERMEVGEYKMVIEKVRDPSEGQITTSVHFTNQTSGIVEINAGPVGILDFEEEYRILTLNSELVHTYLDGVITFTVPWAPQVFSASADHIMFSFDQIRVFVKGDKLPTGQSFTARLSTGKEFEMIINNATDGTGYDIRVGPGTRLDWKTTYQIDTMISWNRDAIVVHPNVLFTIPHIPTVKIYLNRNGSLEDKLCGTEEAPCQTLGVGWKATAYPPDPQLWRTVVVDGEACVGSQIETGREFLVIMGKNENDFCTLTVESSLISKDLRNRAIVTSWLGNVTLTKLKVALPSFRVSASPLPPLCVVGGQGIFVVNAVSIVNQESQTVSMSLLNATGGLVVIKHFDISQVYFEEGVSILLAQSTRDKLEFIVTDTFVKNTTTLNAPLVLFNSTFPDSSFTFKRCSFLNTKQTVSSPSLSTIHSLISLYSPPLEISLQECVFENCGSYSRAGSIVGPALLIATQKNGTLAGGVSGWLSIALGERLARVKFENSHFEQYSPTLPPYTRDDRGVPKLDLGRKVLHPTGSSPNAVHVVHGSIVPSISRFGTKFSLSKLVIELRDGSDGYVDSVLFVADDIPDSPFLVESSSLTLYGRHFVGLDSGLSLFENISVSDIGNIVRIRNHTHEDWHINRVSVLCSDSPLNGVIFGDLNVVNSAYVSDSEIQSCTTTRTASNDNNPKLVTIDGVKFDDYVVHSSTEFVSIEGQSLKIRKCSFVFHKRQYYRYHSRAIFFNTPTGTLDVSSTKLKNCSAVDGSGGSCVLSLGAQTVTIGPDVTTKFICGWQGHDGFVFYGWTEYIMLVELHNENADTYAVSPESYSSSGVFVRISGQFEFIQHNSTYYKCSTDGRGAGITFDAIKPKSTMKFVSTYFVRNGGNNAWQTKAYPGGSVTFAPLADPEGVSVVFTTCRFRSRIIKADGDDIYAGSGWKDIITPSSFDCSYCSGSQTSVYIEGVTGTNDTNMIPVKKIEGCPVVKENNKFLMSGYLFHIIFWPCLAFLLLAVMLTPICIACGCCSCLFHCIGACCGGILCWPCLLYDAHEDKKYFNKSKKETHKLDADEDMERELQEGNWIKTSDALGYVSAARNRYVDTMNEAIELVKYKAKHPTGKRTTVENEYEKNTDDNDTDSSGYEASVENPLLPKEEVDYTHSSSSFHAMKDNLTMLRFFIEGTHVHSQTLRLLEWLE
ncbi:hypothetical protein BLNAU_4432 [Blattamonas nauphoetae]|uniref:Uncharacterized protein n=1 Tax=Blattamonas nauphoetae TaxID=2049346 RepID=A0ABQ9YA03_9EUKA|nr:hypothetical protein BLNAU_4432 [Blattamonas nauphoetae]